MRLFLRPFLILLCIFAFAACQESDPETIPPLLLAPPDVSFPETPAATNTAVPLTTAATSPAATATEVPPENNNQVVSTNLIPTCTKRQEWPTYTVQPGDTISKIARASSTTAAEIAAANCLADPSLILVGDVLYVPRLPSPTATTVPILPSPTPFPDLSTYLDPDKRVQFQYPAEWQEVYENGYIRFEGDTGFASLQWMNSPYHLQATAEKEANHHLRPYGTSPLIETIWLADGREARRIIPSADQPAEMNNQAAIIAPYGDPVYQGNNAFNYLLVYADKNHIALLGSRLTISPGRAEPTITEFEVSSEDLPYNGKRLTFRWHSYGATRGTIQTGTATEYDTVVNVGPRGEMTIDVSHTIFPDPVITLTMFNQVNGRSVVDLYQIEWACTHHYFFTPEPHHCADEAPEAINGAYQPFENGFMIYQPDADLYPYNGVIFVFFDGGAVQRHQDTWLPGDGEGDNPPVPPEGYHLPIRGFGKLWRTNPEIQQLLGWATEPETAYTYYHQYQDQDAPPSTSYLQLVDGQIIKITGEYFWEAWQ